MSRILKAAAVTFGATTVAMLSIGLASGPSQAARPIIENACERVCIDGSCIYSCSKVKARRAKIKLPPPTTRPDPQPQPVPYMVDWRDKALYSSGGGGGGGGGGGNR